MGIMSNFDDPRLTARINSMADRLTAIMDRNQEERRLVQARIDRDTAEREIARRERKAAMQADAIEAYAKWGELPPPPRADESPRRYDRRILRDQQRHLPPGNLFSSTRLSKLPDDPDALGAIAPRIRQAFVDSHNDPATVREGEMREIKSEDHAGHKVSTFVGRRSFIFDMSAPCRQVLGGVDGMRRQVENLARWTK
jgi:hypothetical protein